MPSRLSRLVGRPAFWVAFFALVFALPLGRALLRPPPEPLPLLGALPPFHLVESDGVPMGSSELGGHVYIASFLFTTCGSACPMIARKVSAMQKRIAGAEGGVLLVSFTVDPERDTPARLAEFGRAYGRNPRLWKLLTGPRADLEPLITRGFKVAMGKPGEMAHTEKVVLVDTGGQIRGYYDLDPAGVDAVLHDAGRLINEPAAGRMR
jgi:protein SCO1/2